MFFSFFFIFLTLATSTFASIGETCRAAGVKGTCQKIGSCNTGVTIKGACPNDPDGIRCCIKKSCQQDSTKKQGMCYDKRNHGCSGGKFITGECPGDANMQCCIPNAAPAPAPPPPPSCPAARAVPIKFLPDDVIFSRGATKKVGDVYRNSKQVLDVCKIISGAIPGGQTVGIACGIASAGTGFIADHADECAKKNQCLKLKAYTLPFCIGANDGCC